jgi:hypothetical protein
VFDGVRFDRLSLHWKHGIPNRSIDYIAEKVIKIFIVRNLEEWLVSMYDTPHYLEREQCCFKCFLKREQRSAITKGSDCEIYEYSTGDILNKSDEEKTIFQIRYEKMKAYQKFYRENDTVCFVNLKYLENEKNCIHFLKTLFERFDTSQDIDIIGRIDRNVKDGSPCINRHTCINFDQETSNIITRYKNDTIEDWVNNMTFEIKK